MLIYHPAFDMHHCIFRMVQLLLKLPQSPHSVEQVRILDFFLLFPELLSNITLPQDAKKYRKNIKAQPSLYEIIDNPRRLFLRLEPYQITALHCLASYEMVNAEMLSHNKIQLEKSKIPQALNDAVENASSHTREILELLTGPLSEMALFGEKGLKARTDLFEFRYDPS